MYSAHAQDPDLTSRRILSVVTRVVNAVCMHPILLVMYHEGLDEVTFKV